MSLEASCSRTTATGRAPWQPQDPDFFTRLAHQQSPQYLWIGCSDRRVPANQIIGLAPGEVFVHRNIANVVVHTDLNCLSVIQFAVDMLKVRHIIVCGHYGCSGVHAAMTKHRIGLADNWLRHVQDVAAKHGSDLGRFGNEDERHRPPVRAERARARCENIVQCTAVQEAWERGQPLEVHGWIYDLKDGLIHDLHVSKSRID